MTSFAAFVDEYFVAPKPPARVRETQADVAAVDSLAFTHALVALAAQLAAVDGTPKKSEYLAFQSLFVAQGEADEAKLRSLFVKHVGASTSSLQYARHITAMTHDQQVLRQEIFVRFVRIATADGMLNAAEMEWLRAVGAAFAIEAATVRQLLAQCFTSTAHSPYATLGVTAASSDEAVRAAYMARVQSLHPDRFQAAGASAETVSMLSEQLAAVNAAYHAVCTARQKKSAFAPARLWPTKREKSAKAKTA